MLDHKAAARAITALGTALHGRTCDTETMAAVWGFRRIAHDSTFDEIFLEMYGTGKGRSLIKQAQQDELISLREQLNVETEARAKAERELDRVQQQTARIGDRTMAKRETETRTFPMLCTEVVRARFGDWTWDHPVWNKLRRDIVVNLIKKGISIDEINKSVHTVKQGKYENYTYVEAADISLKTRNPTEICGELYALAMSLGMPIDIEVRWKNKAARQTGKAGGKYAQGAALPGATARITWDNPPLETVEQPPPEPEEQSAPEQSASEQEPASEEAPDEMMPPPPVPESEQKAAAE